MNRIQESHPSVMTAVVILSRWSIACSCELLFFFEREKRQNTAVRFLRMIFIRLLFRELGISSS